MKKVILITLLMSLTVIVTAQRQYSFAKKTVYTQAWDSTVNNVTLNNTLTGVIFNIGNSTKDTTTINWSKSISRVYNGDVVYFITSNIGTDTVNVRFTGGFIADAFNQPPGTIYVNQFFYNGVNFYRLNSGIVGMTGARGATGATGLTGPTGSFTQADTVHRPKIFTGTDTAGITPTKIGDIYVKTDSAWFYMSKSAVRGGWRKIN